MMRIEQNIKMIKTVFKEFLLEKNYFENKINYAKMYLKQKGTLMITQGNTEGGKNHIDFIFIILILSTDP